MQKGKSLVKATFDDITDLNDIIDSLEKLCIPQTEEEWRNILISSPKMFKVCEKGFIYISKEEILLLGKWYLNHYHSELFTYHLWVEKFKDEDVSFEGFCKEYAWQNVRTLVHIYQSRIFGIDTISTALKYIQY